MSRKGIPVSVNGVDYSSGSEAARAIAAQNPEAGPTEIAKIINDAAGKPVVSVPTVALAVDKYGKVKIRLAAYQALRLAKSGKYTANAISERAGISRGVLQKLLESNNLTCPTKDELKTVLAAKKPTKTQKTKKTKTKTVKAAVAQEPVAPELVAPELAAPETAESAADLQ